MSKDDKQRRNFVPRRKTDMKDNIYKVLFTVMAGIVVVTLIYIADSQKATERLTGDIKESVYTVANIVGRHDERLNNHDKKFDKYDTRIGKLETKVDTHTLNDAKYWGGN